LSTLRAVLRFHVPCLAARLVQAMNFCVSLLVYRYSQLIDCLECKFSFVAQNYECENRTMGGQKHVQIWYIIQIYCLPKIQKE
jgi:hypothetical protein